MVTGLKVVNANNQEINVDIIMRFKIEESNKEYVVYTINDDGKSEDVYVNIAGLEEKDGKYQLRLIPEEEKNMVLVFYDNLRDTINGNR
jgi:uncharacterized protein YrzB (UPF0473 family)